MSSYQSNLADGVYTTEIISMNTTKSVKGNPVVEWKLRIQGGQHDQVELSKQFHLTTEKVKAFLKKELAMLDVHVSNGQEFEEQKHKCIGKHIRIAAVTNEEGWQSLYLKEVVHKAEENIQRDDDELGW
jgi:hypothetical protein